MPIHSAIDERSKRITIATAYGEARGQPDDGVAAVVWVIANRAANHTQGRWGGPDLASVCLAPRQFSCWNRGDPNRAKILALFKDNDTTRGWSDEALANSEFDRVRYICEQVFAGSWPSPVMAATHYHAPYVTPAWARGQPLAVIGDHMFFTGEQAGHTGPFHEARFDQAPAVVMPDVPKLARKVSLWRERISSAWREIGAALGGVAAYWHKIADMLPDVSPELIAYGLLSISAILILWIMYDAIKNRVERSRNGNASAVRGRPIPTGDGQGRVEDHSDERRESVVGTDPFAAVRER